MRAHVRVSLRDTCYQQHNATVIGQHGRCDKAQTQCPVEKDGLQKDEKDLGENADLSRAPRN